MENTTGLPDPNDRDDVAGIDEDKLMAVLSYIGILVFIPLFTRRHDSFIQFHAKQGLVIFIGEVIALLASQWIIFIGNLLFVVLLIASVIGLIQALQGRRFTIPVIGKLANKFTI